MDEMDVVIAEDVEVNEDIIEVGRAQGRAVKGEDTLYVRGIFDGPADQRQLCAAVFDGHGGKVASAAALKTVGDRLMDQGPPFNDALIANQHGTSKSSLAITSPHACAGLPPGPKRRASRGSPFVLLRRDCHGALLSAQTRRLCTTFDHLQADAFWQADQAPVRSTCATTTAYMRSILAPPTCASPLRGQRATHGPWCGQACGGGQASGVGRPRARGLL